MTSPEGDPLAGLVSLVGRQGRRLDDQGKRLDGLQGAVTELANLVANRVTEDADGAPQALWWPEIDPGEERTEALRAFLAWVDDVLRGRHPESYRGITPCWFLHPEVLDDLTSLYVAWLAAYRDPTAPATASIEWHDRWMPSCLERCRQAIKSRGCDRTNHIERPSRTDEFLGSDELKRFIAEPPKQS